MKYLTVKQAAEECGLSIYQIKRACKNERVKMVNSRRAKLLALVGTDGST